MNSDSIFFQLELPNATTWFYFSSLLAVAFFFKFTRLLTVRNLDTLALYLPVPGFLLLLEHAHNPSGYLWLYCATAYFLLRCLFDLALSTRPALQPNVGPSGLAWLGGALLLSLAAVSVREPDRGQDSGHSSTAGVQETERQARRILDNFPGEVGNPSVWTRRSLAIACHAASVAALIFIGYKLFQDAHAGIAAAVFYLLLPYTYLMLPYNALNLGQWHQVWPAAMILWTIACYRWPTFAGIFFGLAVGIVYFPVVLLPLFLSFYWGRGAGRFTVAAFVTTALCLVLIGGMLAADKLPHELTANLADWQPWKEPQDVHGFWSTVPYVYRIPVFVLFVAFVITTAFWPSPKNVAHVAALSAAIFCGLQLWYADQGGIYVFWYLGLMLVLMFRPNLSDRRPQLILPETDWLARLARWAAGMLQRKPRVAAKAGVP
jgi:hypothetical protein